MVRFVSCMLLLVAPVLAGCDAFPSVSASPTSATTMAVEAGSLRGFVYGKGGPGQPLAGARVQAGGLATLTGRPAEEHFLKPGDAKVHARDGIITVWHDFDDGRGVVPAERRIRAVPGGEPYVFLRAGEFLLEGLTDGPTSLVATLCDMTSPPLSTVVTGGRTIDGVVLSLPQPLPLANEDYNSVRTVAWKSSSPEDGFVVSLVPEGDRLIYTPSPPTLSVTLQAPVYSRGTTIRAFEIEYAWRTADGASETLKSPRIPIAPLMVPTASETCPGAPVTIKVPLGTAEFIQAFERGAGQVMAKIRFIELGRFEVQDPLLNTLGVATNIRKL